MNCDLLTEITRLIAGMNEQQLRALRKSVDTRITSISQEKKRKLFSSGLYVGCYVCFSHKGSNISGQVIRINRKTVTIYTKDGSEWVVSPHVVKPLANVQLDKLTNDDASLDIFSLS